MDERSESVRDVPDVHAWLLVENFTISRKLLTHCLNTSDVIFPASHAHVKFYAKADPVLVALKNVYSTNTDDDTSLGDPVSSYRFCERSHEVGHIGAYILHPSVRLVVISGPPGMGKTSLVTAVAQHLHVRAKVHALVYISTVHGHGMSLVQMYVLLHIPTP
ncbi:hypothetical protein DYB31_005806 [Aphanomyces astaci]|uniref:ATPase AAA-type core domain-containing protein n=1 Tax=Aphanomyces astaci TaxID=112090 RepID=A0A397FYU1_APHAT|nr:hypothetical protein DYB31_005806 [Aphanomyces astaci]